MHSWTSFQPIFYIEASDVYKMETSGSDTVPMLVAPTAQWRGQTCNCRLLLNLQALIKQGTERGGKRWLANHLDWCRHHETGDMGPESCLHPDTGHNPQSSAEPRAHKVFSNLPHPQSVFSMSIIHTSHHQKELLEKHNQAPCPAGSDSQG